MHTPNLANENYKKLAELFPDAVTETVDEEGNVVRAIDKDVLMQEINTRVVDDGQQRYQFTWPDKRKAILLANEPIAKTLRLDREKSVSRDGTPGGEIDSENIYIEGDNLDALKLLRETYLGKVKMIYIDPPYNTGNDFIYEDDFTQSIEDYKDNSGQLDEEGNRLVQNLTSNGRFHTDWLNMIYPRLKISKDLLQDNGVIFISIDDNELENLIKVGKEIFGERNYINILKWKRKKQPSFLSKHIAPLMEYIVIFAKNEDALGKLSIENVSDSTKKVINISNPETERYFKAGVEVKGIKNGTGKILKGKYVVKTMQIEYLDDVIIRNHKTINPVRVRAKFLNTQDKIDEYIDNNLLFITKAKGLRRYVSPEESNKEKSITDLLLNWGDNQDSEKEQRRLFGCKYFDYSKPTKLIFNLIKSSTKNNDIIMDFFSGSATTADACLQLNAEDEGHRKFILIQLPEGIIEGSEAYEDGIKSICDIGEERIRRAAKIIEEETEADIDYGFRCFKVDSTNMKEVYYNPSKVKQMELSDYTDNIKEDRTPEDLLIQVMLDLGVLLSSKVEEKTIAEKKVYSVADGYMMACFDQDITDEVVTAIAKAKPFYAVFRDSSMADDSVAANFEQIFAAYSPETIRKVL